MSAVQKGDRAPLRPKAKGKAAAGAVMQQQQYSAECANRMPMLCPCPVARQPDRPEKRFMGQCNKNSEMSRWYAPFAGVCNWVL